MAFNKDIIFINGETPLNDENMNNFMEGINESLDNSETAIKKADELKTSHEKTINEIKNLLWYDSIDNYTIAFDESGKILWATLDTSLSGGVFYVNCPTATKIVLGKNITSINGAFATHENIVDIYLYPDNEALLINAFATGVTGLNTEATDVYIRKLGRNFQFLIDLQIAIGLPILNGNITFEKLDSDLQNTLNELTKVIPLPWSGLKVSVIGDSTSAYKGYVPEGNSICYTGENFGVSSYTEMWWNVLCEKLGGERCVIEAWNASSVASGVGSATEASNIARCQHLHTDDAEPDIVIISMGNNDCGKNVPLGDWDGTTELDSKNTSDFRSAYANMLARIHLRYPRALIFCLSPTFTMRLIAEKHDTGRNELGLTYADYENAIKDVANLMQCVFVDQNNFGFNRYNYFNNFCIDYPETPMHANAQGHYIMGTTLAEKMKQLATGYVEWLKLHQNIIMYSLTGDDLVQGSIAKQSTGHIPSYTTGHIAENSAICSKADLTMPIAGGTKLLVEIEAVDTTVELEVALQTLNQNAVDAFWEADIGYLGINASDLTETGKYSKASGWLASGTEYTIPSAGKSLLVTAHRKDGANITPSEIKKITITQVS